MADSSQQHTKHQTQKNNFELGYFHFPVVLASVLFRRLFCFQAFAIEPSHPPSFRVRVTHPVVPNCPKSLWTLPGINEVSRCSGMDLTTRAGSAAESFSSVLHWRRWPCVLSPVRFLFQLIIKLHPVSAVTQSISYIKKMYQHIVTGAGVSWASPRGPQSSWEFRPDPVWTESPSGLGPPGRVTSAL